MNNEAVVLWGFWGAFLIDIAIVIHAFKLSKRMGSSGLFHKTTIYIGASAFIFGLHHILELLLEGFGETGLVIAESIEGIAAICLGLAVYQMYKIFEGA
jgi:uncharacterized membrane protein